MRWRSYAPVQTKHPLAAMVRSETTAACAAVRVGASRARTTMRTSESRSAACARIQSLRAVRAWNPGVKPA